MRLKSLRQEDLSFCHRAASFLQSGFWGSFKARFEWEPLAFRTVWTDDGGNTEEEKSLLVLRRLLSKAFKLSLAYIPWGPELPGFCSDRNAALGELAALLKKTLPPDTVFIRFDPPWFTTGEFSPEIPLPFSRSGADIQPPDTVIIDLTQTMESIMDQMKPKWRYNARLALKKGVSVYRAESEKIDAFYALLKETARRDGIAIHSADYYKGLFEESLNKADPSVKISLYLADHEGETIAGIVTLFRGKEAVYLYGASSDQKRNLMAPYALQIKAMEDAKAEGAEKYDLFGIPPNEDPSHPMAGLYRFKTGFGGMIIHHPGSWDYPCRPVLYRLFRLAERARKNLRTMKKIIKRR